MSNKLQTYTSGVLAGNSPDVFCIRVVDPGRALTTMLARRSELSFRNLFQRCPPLTRMFLRERSTGESAKQSLNDYGRYAGVGLQFGVTLVVFAAAGYWLDQKFGTRPWLLISGVLLGSGGAFYSMLRRIPPSSKQTWAEKKREREEAARTKKNS